MRLNRIRLQGIMAPFRGKALDVDFSGMRGLIALVGNNGEGKTTVLEAPFATLFARFASRDKALYEYADGTDAFLSCDFVDTSSNGDEYEINATLQINAEQRRTEFYLLEDGNPTVSGKSGPYKEAIARLFGTRELVLASVLAAQNRRGNFVDMPKGDRKSVFMRLLGLESLPAMFTRARERTRVALENVERTRRHARESAEAWAKLKQAEDTLDTRLEMNDEAERKRDRYATARRVAEEQAIKVETLSKSIGEDPRPTLWQAHDTHKANIRRLDERRSRSVAMIAMKDGALVAQRRAAELALDIGLVERKIEAVREAQALVERYKNTAEAAQANIDKVHDQRTAEAEVGSLIDEVPCAGVDDAETGAKLGDRCKLLSRARAARVNAAMPVPDSFLRMGATSKGTFQEAQATLDRLKLADGGESKLVEQIRRDRMRLSASERLAGRIPEIERAEEALTEVEHTRTEIQLAFDELERHMRSLIAAYDESVRELDALRSIGDVRRELGLAKEAHENAERAAQESARVLSESQAQVEALQLESQRADADAKAHEIACSDLDEWGLLEEALSPNGIQALEVANAGPDVAAIANSLLAACYGPRFSIRFETLRERQSGGMQEVFDIQVFDGQEQRTVEDLSGGEGVIVGEGINLALAIYNARKSGINWRTLWRDETAGALSPDNAERYVQMLRRSLEVGGFEQVIFVAHVPQVWEAADVRLHFEDGGYTVG